MNTGPSDPRKQTIHLVPPSQESEGDDGSKNKLIVIIAVLLCLLFGLLLYGVLIILPDRFSPPPAAPPVTLDIVSPVSKETNSPTVIETSTESPSFRDGAESALTRFLNLQSRLESEKISVWGVPSYEIILTSLLKGDEHFKKHEYEIAQTIYNELAIKLKTLSEEKQEIFRKSLSAGQKNLEKKNSTEAEAQFTIALAINNDDQTAVEGLKRAKNLDYVQELIAKGHSLEVNDQLDQAIGYYQQAYQLDNLSNEAKKAYTELQSKITERDFKSTIASFYQALQNGDFKDAEKSLNTASNLHPNDIVVNQARSTLQQEKQNKLLNELRISGGKLSEEEKWQQAIEIYTKALTLSPHADFAMRGKENAQNNKLINAKVDALLHSLPDLQEDKVLKNAENLLLYSSSLNNIGPKLNSKISALSIAVNNAKQVLRVTLFSDNMTNVVIYHVGRLGKFHQKRIDLRPGKYTIVAQKPGYRNTRVEMILSHEENEHNFTILCKDPI